MIMLTIQNHHQKDILSIHHSPRETTTIKPTNQKWHHLKHIKCGTAEYQLNLCRLIRDTLSVTIFFIGYEMVFFSFQNNPKNLDLPYRMEIDLLDCLKKGKACQTDLVI